MKKILESELPDEKGLYGGNSKGEYKMNCEHVWPQSFFKGKYPMKSDMNHCFFTNSRLNSHRNSYRFLDIESVDAQVIDKTGKKTDVIVGDCSIKCNYDRTFEPRDVSKGNVARAIAYFNTMYPDYDMSKVIDTETMIKWHKEDPVSEGERLRTNVIYKHQHNLNPYIVCPELLEIVYKKEITADTINHSISLLKDQILKLEQLLEEQIV